MKLYYDKRAKDPIYYIQQGLRNGKKTTTRNIARIGKHSELLKITSDPLAYAKEQVALRNEERSGDRTKMETTIDFSERLSPCNAIVSSSNQLNIGYFVLQAIYHKLDINSFFKAVTADLKITFNADQANRFMTYARILDPDSKLGTYDHLHRYYEQPKLEYIHLLRTMDILEQNYDAYISHLFEHSRNIVERDTSVCYFDCTNYYFEIEEADEDYIDEVTGEIIKGLRKYGPAKDHKPNPLVEMGLFIDAKGIPLSMCINSGSDNEQICALPLERKLVKMLEGKRFIYCADAGLGSINIRKFNSMGGRAFIITQSIKKLSEPLQEAVFNDFGYRFLPSGEDEEKDKDKDNKVSIEMLKTFDKTDEKKRSLYEGRAYKIFKVDRLIDLGLYEEKIQNNGKAKNVKAQAILKQNLIVTFSRKMMEYQRTIRNKQIERAKALMKKKDPENLKKGPHDVTRFIKRVKSKDADDTYIIDQSVIDNEEKYDGFYAIATNLDDDVKDILAISSNRYKIEDCFRVMKSNFSARPVYHRNRERIIAHFMICYTALLIDRLLEAKLDANGTHFTTDNIIETLKNMEVMNMQDMYYSSLYSDSKVCSALNDVFGLGLDKKHYQAKFLNKKAKKI